MMKNNMSDRLVTGVNDSGKTDNAHCYCENDLLNIYNKLSDIWSNSS